MEVLEILKKPNGAMGLGRVLIFLFGVELLILTPIVVLVGRDNHPYVATWIFFLVLFLAVIYSKVVDSRYLGISINEGDKNENHD